ncbi:DUF4261 domain-containing protein [Neobacillus massiliamazoniensis]|uniref:DUF4261 domain-containing protein n=1 Tax=Neobacillus massiliamazoniensis TaxID=1499688 RepID=A0A0U1P4C9_9BACI|nr:DUF4261 domain-containing protein [Neobacillus massiliamazoniensis]CRK85100.1 hypothetical protein BN000_05160 [Neobacillus massiliamazoniensis]
MAEVQVIIGVPGKWKNRTELIQSVVSNGDGYLMAGYIIHNAKKDVGFEVEVYEHDPHLKEAFSYAGTFEDSLLDEIEHHTLTVYVIANIKGFEGLKQIVDVGATLLKSGGLAVKIETSGIAHTKDEWFQLLENQDYFPIYSHFVNLVGDEESYFSCGMKAFGLPDVITPSSISPEEASDLLNNFNLYNIVEHPSFKNGETFSLEENSPLYKIDLINEYRYEEDDVFFNPFGLINLIPA